MGAATTLSQWCMPAEFRLLKPCLRGAVQAREKGGFVRDTEEEYEDAQGNVYNKRTYEDLRRQGII